MAIGKQHKKRRDLDARPEAGGYTIYEQFREKIHVHTLATSGASRMGRSSANKGQNGAKLGPSTTGFDAGTSGLHSATSGFDTGNGPDEKVQC